MSLVENLARRRHTSIELAEEIRALRERGYKYSEIARKTDLVIGYVRDIDRLLRNGEERLLQAVERGQIPISVAITIASSDDAKIQRANANSSAKAPPAWVTKCPLQGSLQAKRN
jgi:ParB family chromosome partitioning protein